MKRAWLGPIAAVLLLGAAAEARPPNLVLIIGDDHGWPYAGFMGHETVLTPALDSLADEGTVFTNAQLPASICRPSLQTLLSGLHPLQWVAKRAALSERTDLPRRQEVVHYRTLPRELAREGYRSWEGGKMWEGTYDQAGFTAGLADIAHPGPFLIAGGEFGRQDWDSSRCGPLREGDAPCPALASLREFLDEAGDAPFFLWFAPRLPHTPFDPPIEFVLPYLRPGLTNVERTYYAQVTRLDALVGELLRELDVRGVRDDTLIAYVSDNGWEPGQGLPSRDPRHGKGSLHELGTRTPIVFHWRGGVPAGVVRDQLVGAEDVFPTLLDYAGAEPLPDRRGASLRRAIEGRIAPDEETGSARDVRTRGSVGLARYVSSRLSSLAFFVRTPDWRYMLFRDLHEELYQIAVDPFEAMNLADVRADLIPGFQADFFDWFLDVTTAPPRLEITGRLIDGAGAPIAGASLTLDGNGEILEVLTDTEGAFRFQHLPHGSYTIGGGERVTLSVPIGTSLPVGPVGRHLPAVVGIASDDVRRPGSARISGRLLRADGAAMPDARVWLERRGTPRAPIEVAVRTDTDGRYLAENLPPGAYEIRAGDPMDGAHSAFGRCAVGERGRCTRDLVAGGMLRGQRPLR